MRQLLFMERGVLFGFASEARRRQATAEDPVMLEMIDSAAQGRFPTAEDALAHLAAQTTPDRLYAVMQLVAYATPRRSLKVGHEGFVDLLRDDDHLLEQYCIALIKTGLPDLVGLAATTLFKNVAAYEGMDYPYQLSLILEPSWGAVFAGPDDIRESEFHEPAFDMADYRSVVTRAVEQTRDQHPTNTALLFGSPVNLSSLATELLHTLPVAPDNEDIVAQRSLIEAYTGFDLSAFYKNILLDRTAAAAAIEQLFDSVDLDDFAPGQRYFFGHRLPDS